VSSSSAILRWSRIRRLVLSSSSRVERTKAGAKEEGQIRKEPPQAHQPPVGPLLVRRRQQGNVPEDRRVLHHRTGEGNQLPDPEKPKITVPEGGEGGIHACNEAFLKAEEKWSFAPFVTRPELLAMVGVERASLGFSVAWLAARSDPPHYGKLIALDFPKAKLVYGPKQIEARIDQDAFISQPLSLWG